MILGLGLLGGADLAHAGGFTIPVIGTRGGSTGGFVARPDDTSAMLHNPAGLGLLGAFQADLAATALLTDVRFRRCTRVTLDASGRGVGCALDSDGQVLLEPEVSPVAHGGLPAGFGLLPFIGISGRLGPRRWNFGLAVYSPHNAVGVYPDCQRSSTGQPVDCSLAPQRFHAVVGSITTIYITPSISFSPWPALHLGLGVSAVRSGISMEQALWLGGPGGQAAAMEAMVQDWNGEGRVSFEASAWTLAASFGLLWQVGRSLAPGNRWLRGLSFGVSVASPASLTFRSDLRVSSPLVYSLIVENEGCRKGASETYEVTCQVAAALTFPMQIRWGVHWQLNDRWGAGAEVTWQNYRSMEEFRLRLIKPLVLISDAIKVSEVTEPKDAGDCTIVAAGVQHTPRWAPGLELRLGIIWDQSPYPDATYSLLSPDSDKLGLVLAATYAFSFGLELSVAYSPFFFRSRQIRDSALLPRICARDDALCNAMVPDGDFSMNGEVPAQRVDSISVQVGWRFGASRAF